MLDLYKTVMDPDISETDVKPDREITFFCVLKSGKKYSVEHVSRLKAAVERNTSLPIKFVCLSDIDTPCERIPLKHEWPGFWSKIELFRKDVSDPSHLNVYIDLDVLVTNNLDHFLSHPHHFTMTRDARFPDRANSSVMAWTGDHSDIYDNMVRNPYFNRFRFGVPSPWYGDQALIEQSLIHKGTPPSRIDDIFNESSKCVGTVRRRLDDIYNGRSKCPDPIKTIDEVGSALFVSFQGPIAKPGSPERRNDPLIQKYWEPSNYP